MVFDEAYYARDSCLYVGYSQDFCNAPQATEQSYVHPPLGKWIIASGIKIFGYNAFGWRIMSAVFGIAIVPLVYVLARRLFRDQGVGLIAGLLVTADFLLIVQSRIAMLDIFLAFFMVLGFLFLAIDREKLMALRTNALLPFPGEHPRRDPEWRYAAGAAFGMAVAVKWAAGPALLAAAVMALFWSVGYIRDLRLKQREWEEGPETLAMSEPSGRLLRAEIVSTVLAFVLLPILIYLLSYSLWFRDNLGREHCDDSPNPICSSGVLATGREFIELHERILTFHIDLEASHPYQSRAWTWPFVKRPVAYYYTAPPQTEKVHHIVALGNPVVWWPAIAAGVWLLIRSLRKWAPERFVVVAWLSQYLPWLLVGPSVPWVRVSSRVLFIFYMTPIVPFMMIGLAAAIASIREFARPLRWAVLAYFVIAVGLLTIYFYPVLVGGGLTHALWMSRMWFNSWV